jgi:hypothetical protein
MTAPSNRRSRASRNAFAVAAGVGVLAVIVVLVTNITAGRTSPARPAVAPAAMSAGAPGTADAASERRALDAGVGYATLMARLFPLDATAARAVLAAAASDAYRQELTAAVDAELVPLQRQVAGLAGRPIYRQAVLAAEVVSYIAPRARVAAWVMLTAGQAGVNDNATATFATVTVDVVFEHGAWKLDHTSEQPGPSPEVHDSPASVDSLASRLDGFADWRPNS